MNGKEFLRRLSIYAKANSLDVELSPQQGKGGHQLVRLAGRPTTVKTGEIGKGLLAKMLKDLNVPKGKF
ncbi:hypothetical protein [Maricaulis sp.]|uniref:hypothetical protein n=1 Tax=Maricaulis sp. TaxID=1486257 RepID=UPI003A912CEA